MVPMEQDYVMYDAPMAYEQPYEMQYEMGYPAVQPMYAGYDQNFQVRYSVRSVHIGTPHKRADA